MDLSSEYNRTTVDTTEIHPLDILLILLLSVSKNDGINPPSFRHKSAGQLFLEFPSSTEWIRAYTSKAVLKNKPPTTMFQAEPLHSYFENSFFKKALFPLVRKENKT